MKVFFEGTPNEVKAEMTAFLNQIPEVRVKVEPELAPVPAPAPVPAVSAAQTQQKAVKISNPQPATTLFPAAPKAAPAPAPAPAVPTAPARTYTLEDLLTAAGPLMDQGKFAELTALTAKYGVKSFNDIPADQYGNVAVDLRALGAQL
ncbi:hypothetical protein [uncultured Acidaminococcus sp.]|uniref:hypothetical protein n=1 Tax=uncultured Acidaminococcus sp. TaxID=352152 RepID=UPI0026DDBF46|nr:hypothetical protein [uncultured Acidaminococcus sp.]